MPDLSGGGGATRVPIFLRAGKALPERVTEVRLFTRRVPALAFMPQRERAQRNQIVLRIDPDPGMRLHLVAQDDQGAQAWRDVHAYERGSWGPEAAHELVRGHRSWQEPWLPQGGPSQ